MADTSCSFFDDLPAELRNTIYELAFTTDATTSIEGGEEAFEACCADEIAARKTNGNDEKATSEKDGDWEDVKSDEDPHSDEVSGQEDEDKTKATQPWDSAIELVHAVPPSKALLLTCRRVCKEAKGIYKKAYRDYWCNSHFKISVDPTNDPYDFWTDRIDFDSLHKATNTDVEMIHFLTIIDARCWFDEEVWRLADKQRGTWNADGNDIWVVRKPAKGGNSRLSLSLVAEQKALEDTLLGPWVTPSLIDQVKAILGQLGQFG